LLSQAARNDISRDNEGMVHGSRDTVAFRLWPPVAIGGPLLVGLLATLQWGDPVDLGGWRVPLGWVLVLLFAGWNGWSLWLFRRHDTGLLPGQPTHALIEQGPYRLSRNPLYVGLLALYLGVALLAPTFWGLVLFPVAVLLVLWGPSAPRSDFCASGSVRRTTTTPIGCVAGCEQRPTGKEEPTKAVHAAADWYALQA
jgi:protein-S-isoprenylcysteine O-methyltransferase Ste14